MNEIQELLSRALHKIQHAQDLQMLNDVRVEYLGKKGSLTLLLKNLVNISNDERPAVGKAVNEAKLQLQELIKQRQDHLDNERVHNLLENEKVDVSLPGRGQRIGHAHPISICARRIENFFAQLGFETITGPEIETEFYNFNALNIPLNHPARDMQDTFYLPSDLLLRTHTSSVQIRYMEKHQPPIKIIVPGRVYRRDDIDMTHTPMFHQVEGLYVTEQANFAELKGILIDFMQHFFEQDVKVRFRPSYFPFTEPSAEVDIQMPGSDKWLEVLGCGMVHPNVLQAVNIDSEKYRGFAFGMGIDRLAMLRYGIDDLRLMLEGDLRFLNQF